MSFPKIFNKISHFAVSLLLRVRELLIVPKEIYKKKEKECLTEKLLQGSDREGSKR
jgi:hypothetical protein